MSGNPIPAFDKKRLHYAGNTRGNFVGPVALPDLANLWSMPFGNKKELYGKHGRCALGGGPGEGDADIERKDKRNPPRNDETSEPVAHGAMTQEFYEELLHQFNPRVVINLTSVDVNFAAACLLAKKPYLGLVWTVEHEQMFRDQLNKMTFAAMQKEGPLYQAGLVEVLGAKKRKGKKVTEPETKKAKNEKKESDGEGKTAGKDKKKNKGEEQRGDKNKKGGKKKKGEEDEEGGKDTKKKGKGKPKAKAKATSSKGRSSLLAQLKSMEGTDDDELDSEEDEETGEDSADEEDDD